MRATHRRSATAVVSCVVVCVVGLLFAGGCFGGLGTPESVPSTLFPSRLPSINTTVGVSAIRTREVPHIGTILTDDHGQTLYVNNGDPPRAYAKPKCVGQCTNVWQPVLMNPRAFHPVVQGMAPTVGILPVPGGRHQLAIDDRRVYTFVREQPGQISGNGFVSATPDGSVFRWSVIKVSREAPTRLPLRSAVPTGTPGQTPARTSGNTPVHPPPHTGTPKPVPTTPTVRAPGGGGR